MKKQHKRVPIDLSHKSTTTDLMSKNYRLASDLNDARGSLAVTNTKLSRISMRLITTQSQVSIQNALRGAKR